MVITKFVIQVNVKCESRSIPERLDQRAIRVSTAPFSQTEAHSDASEDPDPFQHTPINHIRSVTIPQLETSYHITEEQVFPHLANLIVYN